MFNSRVKCIFISLIFLPTILNAQTLCFASVASGNKVRLQLTLPKEGEAMATVKYQRGSNDISVIRCKEERISPKSQIPATVKSTFAEMIDGKQVGKYFLTTTGGAVGELLYVRQRDGKKFSFYEDLDSVTESGCAWNQNSEKKINILHQ